NQFRPPSPEELAASTLDAYRAALGAMGNSGLRACPVLGSGLQRSLMLLAGSLARTVTPPLIKETEGHVEQQLQEWGEQTADYFQQRAGDVKEILMVLAHAAEIVRGAKELKTCVDKMEQDGRESVAALRTQVSTYQTKLEEAEQRASHDALTGLDNRQGVESRMQRRIALKQPFCVVMLDLNGFKQVNDRYGHQAGDDLLKQFSTELRAASRATDVVGRWGGDEFVVVLDGNMADAQSHVERMQKWVFGSYTLQIGSQGPKVDMNAAVGLVEWQASETLKEVLARADALMYQHKAEAHKQAPAAPDARIN